MDDRVFLTGISGVDFDCLTVVLLPLCQAYLCELDTLEDELGAAVAPLPLTVTLVSRGGRPLAAVLEYPDLPDLSDEHMDPICCLKQRTKRYRSICLFPVELFLGNVQFVRMTCPLGWPYIGT